MSNLTMRWRAVACCALSACLLAPAAVRAQGSPPPAAVDDHVPDSNTRAAQLYREGNEAFKQKRWSEAELLYLKAWALVRSFDIAANLGEVQLKLNKARSAATFLAFSLRTAPPSAKPEHLARVRHFLEEARKQVGTVRLQVTNVADAEVLVDGECIPAEEVKHEIYVQPGRHQIVVRRAGYQAVELRVLAGAGVRETIDVEMKPLEAKGAEAKGAEAKAPLAERAPVAGGVIVAGKEKTSAPSVGAGVDEPRSWVPVIALGAASAVGLAVGVTTTVLSRNARESADVHEEAVRHANGQCIEPPSELTQHCRELRHQAQRAEGLGTLSVVGYGVSGALAIAAAAYALWPRRAVSPSHGLHVLPQTHTGGGGVLVVGAW